ncbi:MAG: hypothetical protein FWF49_01930 [Oscillospiraceae bacterium]|nr:hypothetical protein [Oscillospiraceae bacterium]
MPHSTPLVPSPGGRNCPGDGAHTDGRGNFIECCCDECEYYLECFVDEGWMPKFSLD